MSQTKWSANCLMGYCNLTLPDRLILILIDKKLLSCTGQSFIGQKQSSSQGKIGLFVTMLKNMVKL